jgi:hypothetical protein
MLFMVAIKLKAGIERRLQDDYFPTEEEIQMQLIKIRKFYT